MHIILIENPNIFFWLSMGFVAVCFGANVLAFRFLDKVVLYLKTELPQIWEELGCPEPFLSLSSLRGNSFYRFRGLIRWQLLALKLMFSTPAWAKDSSLLVQIKGFRFWGIIGNIAVVGMIGYWLMAFKIST